MRRDIVLTPEGWQRLNEELEYLKTVQRKRVSERLREALDFGEAGENPEYEELRKEQAMIEGRIEELEAILSLARVLDVTEKSKEEVGLGSEVTVLDLDTNERLKFVVVDPLEANPRMGYLSVESPIGKALLGKRREEEVTVKVPAGIRRFKIVEIG